MNNAGILHLGILVDRESTDRAQPWDKVLRLGDESRSRVCSPIPWPLCGSAQVSPLPRAPSSFLIYVVLNESGLPICLLGACLSLHHTASSRRREACPPCSLLGSHGLQCSTVPGALELLGNGCSVTPHTCAAVAAAGAQPPFISPSCIWIAPTTSSVQASPRYQEPQTT